MATTDPIKALGALLKAERAALLNGELGALPALIAGKERLLIALESLEAPPSAAALEALKKAASNNQVLLDAALRGVGAARKRLETARNGGPEFSTYDAKGQAATHATDRPSVERRA